MCPQCGSADLRITEYEFGADRETGYVDAGVRVTCRNCGAVSTAEEMDAAMAKDGKL